VGGAVRSGHEGYAGGGSRSKARRMVSDVLGFLASGVPDTPSGIYDWVMGTWSVLLVVPISDDRELQAHVLRSAGLDVLEPSDNPIKDAIAWRPDAVVVDVSP